MIHQQFAGRIVWPRRRFEAFVVLGALIVRLTAAADGPDDPAYLHRQWAWFSAQTPARQQQLRDLDADFRHADAPARAKYTRVLQAYNAWLAKLPESDRRRVADAASAEQRLAIVMDLKEREWVESLPKAYRDEYAKANLKEKVLRVKEWKADEAARDEEWAVAQKNAVDPLAGRLAKLFAGPDRKRVDDFIANLRPALTDSEWRALEDSRTTADDHGQYLGYAFDLARRANQHPLLPGRVGPKTLGTVPEPNGALVIHHFRAKKAGPATADEIKELNKLSGRWPDFALELAKLCQKHSFKLPAPLGDCRKEQMPAEVIAFLNKTLEPKLRETDAGRAQLDAMKKAEGSWPDYPKAIMETARKHNLDIPGWTLPGPPEMWAKFRAGRRLR